MIDTKANPKTFSLRTMFWVVLVVSVLLAGAIFVSNSIDNMFAGNRGPVVDPKKWPRPLKTALESYADATDDINVFEMNDFIDHRSIWRIDGHMNLVDEMIETHKMIPVQISHPMADQLQESIRTDWPAPEFANSEWFATDGFGTVHIEGLDQFLFAVDRNNFVTIVLYHNNF